MNKALALFFFFSSTVIACEVILPEHLIVLGPDSGASPIAVKDCTSNLESDLRQIITEVEGKISATQLGSMLTQKGHEGIQLRPSLIHVRQLSTMIRDQIAMPPGVQVKATLGTNSPNLIPLSTGDVIGVECSSCLFGSRQPLKITVTTFEGNTRTIMATADFMKMVRAYQFIGSVGAFSEIATRGMLKEVYVESIPHTDLISDLEKVKFYKTNKPIRAGDLLKESDLNAINLVRAGFKTEVILENAMIKIKTHGISRSNGSLGDQVEVFHQQKNKKYLGKVIDQNKVLVEL